MAVKRVRGFTLPEYVIRQVERRSRGERGRYATYSDSSVLSRIVERYCEMVRQAAPRLSEEAWSRLAKVPTDDGDVLKFVQRVKLLGEAGDVTLAVALLEFGHNYIASAAVMDAVEVRNGGRVGEGIQKIKQNQTH